MEPSILIAKLMGPSLLVAGAGMLLNTQGYRDMAMEYLRNDALIYFAGILVLVTGLAVVNAHNRWVLDWTLIITVFGWLGIIGGIFRMVYPKLVARIGSRFVDNLGTLRGGGVVMIAVGAVLSYFGYAT